MADEANGLSKEWVSEQAVSHAAAFSCSELPTGNPKVPVTCAGLIISQEIDAKSEK